MNIGPNDLQPFSYRARHQRMRIVESIMKTKTVHVTNFTTRQEAVNESSESLQTKEREAVEVPLLISMHAGQIFLLTKLLTASDLHFYDFQGDVPMRRWYF